MFYYYVIQEDKKSYTFTSDIAMKVEDVRKKDKNAKYLMPVTFFEWIKLSFKFGKKKF